MEDDDEFGDLYTDVLRPLEAQRQQSGPASTAGKAPPQGRPIDLNIDSDDEEILYGASDSTTAKLNPNFNPGSAPGGNSDALVREQTLPQPRGIDLNLNLNPGAAGIDELVEKGGDGSGFDARVLEKGRASELLGKASGESSFMEDEDDIKIIVEEREDKDRDLVEGNTMNLSNDAGEMGSQQMIPGLSGGLENPRAPNIEDEWESEESDDDLQIVLNDTHHGPMGMERMVGVIDEDDEDGEPLVIVADNGDVSHPHNQAQRTMDEKEWGGEEGGSGADMEKDPGDATKTSGGGGGAAPAAVQPKIAYSNHAYHHPFSSQFKVSILFDEHIECNLDSSCNYDAFVLNPDILVMLKIISNIVDELLAHSDEIFNNIALEFSLINEVTYFLHMSFPFLSLIPFPMMFGFRILLLIRNLQVSVVDTN